MFLRKNEFKRLLKSAYKGGLVVGNTGERIYLSGWGWEMDILREYLPKEILAQIIELAGELPEEGESFSSTKEGNQYECRTLEDMTVAVRGTSFPIEMTKVIFDSSKTAPTRIYQISSTGKIVLVYLSDLDMIDNRVIDTYNGEIEAMGPLYAPGEGIFWKNNVMTYKSLYGDTTEEEQELIKKLEGQQLWN